RYAGRIVFQGNGPAVAEIVRPNERGQGLGEHGARTKQRARLVSRGDTHGLKRFGRAARQHLADDQDLGREGRQATHGAGVVDLHVNARHHDADRDLVKRNGHYGYSLAVAGLALVARVATAFAGATSPSASLRRQYRVSGTAAPSGGRWPPRSG